MKWTKQEDEILKQLYAKLPYREIKEKYLMNRSVPSIRGRIVTLGLKPKIFRWSKEDIALLTDKYENGMYIKDIQEKYFPQLSPSQITSKASDLHLKHKVSCEWSIEEDNLLRENFAIYTNKELHELFLKNKTVRAIEARARKFLLNKAEIVWTQEEDNLLKELYGNIKNDELTNHFSKSYNSILRRANELGLKNQYTLWSEDEISYLKTYYVKTYL